MRLLPVLIVLAACANEGGVNRIPHAPEVRIDLPAPNQEYRVGDPLDFVGNVTDSFDTPETLAADWLLDGVSLPVTIGEDGRVDLDLDSTTTELGAHILGLHALDSDGDEASTEVPWTLLGALEAPVVTITDPDDGSTYINGDEVTFHGVATDNNTDANDLLFAWTSSLDGPLTGDISGGGQSVLFTSALTVGTHDVTLSVSDLDGEIGTDAVTVIVREPDEPPVDAEPGDLVFSELNVNPEIVEDMYGEWVELYNTSGSTIDLDGYSFHDLDYDTYTMGSVLIPPHSYVVLCAVMDPDVNGGVETCDGPFIRTEFGGAGSMALGNSGDEVVLSRPDDVVIDQVLYDGSWFTPAVATGLDPDAITAENNDDESMWCDQTTLTGNATEPGTPGFENDQCE